MNDLEYKMTQDEIKSIYRQLLAFDIDIDGFLVRISKADAIGPILDPTLYIKASGNLTQIKNMAQALAPAIKFVKELK